MPHSTSPSLSKSSAYITSTTTWASGSGSAPPYPRELDIGGSSSQSSSAHNTARPLMAYSTAFTSSWQKDFGSGTSGPQSGSWSTRAQNGRNP
ncbi:hypothetical protein HD806DRAFT_492506 [Xylariaceae sp. AK1471]|nr:hypothetical protein HD806DRAFT_492506 [Xylariaceae sp. AK1471]